MARKVDTEPFYGFSMNPFHLLIVIGITIGSYYLANTHWSFGSKELPLRYYYPVGLDKYGRDTLYEHIPPFNFDAQDGQSFSISRKDNLPFMLILSVHVPKEEHQESQKYSSLQKIQTAISESEDVKMATIVFDSTSLSTEQLQALAQQFGADAGAWSVLSGTWKDVHLLLNNGMHLGVDKDSLTLKHPDRIVLIDKHGHTRGRYEATAATFAEDVIADIDVLRKEYTTDLEE